MAHILSEAAEGILDGKLIVGEHGFVRLVDYMGSDQSVVQAARVSYGPGTKTVSEDMGLIDYLMRHDHTTPFEMVVLKFHIKCPIFVARQIVRHRTASMNEESARYSILPDEHYTPEVWRGQDTKNKQGSEGVVGVSGAAYEKAVNESRQVYEDYLGDNVARELARMVLPLSTFTEFYWQMNLHNLFHFLRLRLDPHAQLEVRQYAHWLADCARRVAPVSYQAFEEHQLSSVRFSMTEMGCVDSLLAGETVDESRFGGSKTRYKEFTDKLARIKIAGAVMEGKSGG